ncbi:stimulated by retinoic acid 13, isoform CRA_b [Mus musculus]|nr:stimulated by retinoic acid 13, isoform CRA_b [Mus musculus]
MEGNSGFRKELVSRLLHLHFRDCKTKVSGDALQLMAEFLRIFVLAPGLLEFPPVACKV